MGWVLPWDIEQSQLSDPFKEILKDVCCLAATQLKRAPFCGSCQRASLHGDWRVTNPTSCLMQNNVNWVQRVISQLQMKHTERDSPLEPIGLGQITEHVSAWSEMLPTGTWMMGWRDTLTWSHPEPRHNENLRNWEPCCVMVVTRSTNRLHSCPNMRRLFLNLKHSCTQNANCEHPALRDHYLDKCSAEI